MASFHRFRLAAPLLPFVTDLVQHRHDTRQDAPENRGQALNRVVHKVQSLANQLVALRQLGKLLEFLRGDWRTIDDAAFEARRLKLFPELA